MDKEFFWSDQHSVGDQLLDEQHQHLFDLVCKIQALSSMHGSAPKEIFHELLNDFFDKAGKHFQAEEKVLAHIKYPDLENHRKEHDLIIDELRELLHNSHGENLSKKKLNEIASSWLTHHALESDMAYKHYLSQSDA